jgi:hypothetical protein
MTGHNTQTNRRKEGTLEAGQSVPFVKGRRRSYRSAPIASRSLYQRLLLSCM